MVSLHRIPKCANQIVGSILEKYIYKVKNMCAPWPDVQTCVQALPV